MPQESKPRPERADAARNRTRILRAASELFAERDPQTVTMEDIARKAQVGRGTLYRRYPDRASIAVALLDEHEKALQTKLMSGSPPLGPGAAPAQRLAAFYEAMIGLLEQHAHLVLGTEIGQSRFKTGAYGFWRAHILSLLRAAGIAQSEALVDILLAPVSGDVYLYQRTERNQTPRQLTEALRHLAASVLVQG